MLSGEKQTVTKHTHNTVQKMIHVHHMYGTYLYVTGGDRGDSLPSANVLQEKERFRVSQIFVHTAMTSHFITRNDITFHHSQHCTHTVLDSRVWQQSMCM